MNTELKLETIKMNYRRDKYATRTELVEDIMFQLNCVRTVAERHADRIERRRVIVAYR